MDSHSDLDSDSDDLSFLDISSLPSPTPLELSSKAFVTCTRHSVKACI
jgi:hypothetical protein